MNHNQQVIAVTGASGQQGGAVARHLLNQGWKVRAMTRDPNKPSAQALAKLGAELVAGDLDSQSELEAAFRGAHGVYSVQNFWLPNVGFEGDIRQGKAVAQAAKTAGVKHLVYGSVGAAHRGMGQKHFESKWIIEQFIHSIGLPYTIFRPAAFMQNYNWSRPYILNGIFQTWGLTPDKSLQIIDAEDIGAFAALAFADPDQYRGKTIELAGDELTERQIADTFAKVIGRPVKAVPPSPSEGQQPSEEQLAMFNFFNSKGYDADIPALRLLYPGLLALEPYLRHNGWENAQPIPIPEKSSWR
jgi:uncharacterized protein YbjT (DUF2867 family)